jgi:hypothetical protein
MQFDHYLLALLSMALVALVAPLAALSASRATDELTEGEAISEHFSDCPPGSICYVGSRTGRFITETMATFFQIKGPQPRDGTTELENLVNCKAFVENAFTGDKKKNLRCETTELGAAAWHQGGEHLLISKTKYSNEQGAQDEDHQLLGRSSGGDG